ncbi:MAG: hypothetical protein IPK48_15180 [Gammaproteobacteria bacterium]|nr:hypothetical protein [Gammaproteobacteria bacterium]
MLERAEFLNTHRVFSDLYGTSQHWVEEQLNNGTDVVLEIDWRERSVRRLLPDCIRVFIFAALHRHPDDPTDRPPPDQPEVIQALGTGAREFRTTFEADYLIVNDHFDTALDELLAVVKASASPSPPRNGAFRRCSSRCCLNEVLR